MEPIQDFSSLVSRLRSMKERKRVVVVCPNDPHTEYVIIRSLREGFADFLLVPTTWELTWASAQVSMCTSSRQGLRLSNPFLMAL